MSPVPFSPITVVHRYPASPSAFDGGIPHHHQQQQQQQQLLLQMQLQQQQQQQQQQQYQSGGGGGGYGAPPSSVSAATAEIVAQQSQDYIDEQLAEFQNQIFILQGEFVNELSCTSSY